VFFGQSCGYNCEAKSDEKAKAMRQILVSQEEDGGYVIEVPSLPGCVSQGDTLDEALENIKEAIELYIEVLQEDGRPVPEDLPPLQVMLIGPNCQLSQHASVSTLYSEQASGHGDRKAATFSCSVMNPTLQRLFLTIMKYGLGR
jgi:predicted RNase H-like HicB family nuclease